MSKYGEVIRHARQSESQANKAPTAQPNSQASEPEENHPIGTQTASTETSREDLPTAITSQQSGKPEKLKTRKPEEKEEEVNLSIKVPKSLRRHWVSEAKRHDTTLTAVIIEALKSRFGEPPNS